MRQTLEQALKAYTESGAYPFHMPGHKRRMPGFPGAGSIDITEIDGFDNLHNAKGLLKEAQEYAANLYRAQNAWYLINGSTCGLLAAISAAVPKRSKVLTARNCHKAVYHALFLRELVPVYMYPEFTEIGLQGQISVETVQEAIRENPDARAVILTSPTYDGVLSDIRAIAGLVHAHGMILIVDQAHGAHFGLSDIMPESAGPLGADLVIVSVHKTLPAFTQTALLLRYSDRVPVEKIDEFLDIYETSSPSYVLMAGIDQCVAVLEKQRQQLFAELRENLDRFYTAAEHLQKLQVVRPQDFSKTEAWAFDDSKIIIRTERAGISGAVLADKLRRDFQIELEMASGNYGLALASVMDTHDGFERLAAALREMDQEFAAENRQPAVQLFCAEELYQPEPCAMEIYEAAEKKRSLLPHDEAAGFICAAYIYLYPPGIPMAVPGERITEELLFHLQLAEKNGFEVCGLTENGEIPVIEETEK